MNKVARYFLNVAIGLDQFGNTLWGGYPDETISSRIGRIKIGNGGKIPWRRPLVKLIDAGLNVLDKNHSIEAIEPSEFDEIKNRSVFDSHIGAGK